MLASITPLGEWSRGSRWGVTVSFYLAGSMIAGAAAGGSLGLVGQQLVPKLSSLFPTFPILVLASAVALGLALDLGLFGAKLPSVGRQVSQSWLLRYRGWVYGFGFGLQLGVGVATIVTTSTIYATLVASFLVGSPAYGALIGGTFGLLRAIPIFTVSGIRRPADLDKIDLALARYAAPVRRLAHGTQAAVPAVLVLISIV